MADIELSEAARALKEHFGGQVEGTPDEGRDLMSDVLQEKLGLSADDARMAVEALERAHTIEYVEGGGAIGSIAQGRIPFGEALGAENPAGPATSAEVPMVAGYWRL